MYHILIYPNSGFQNYQELFQEIFEKHNIENPFCDISNCCNTSPCNKGKFYQSFISFDSFSFIPKFKRNQKYLVLYQKNILQVLENAYMQDQTIEKSGSNFLTWIQQNKSQYSQFSSQYLQSTSKSVMYMDYQVFEKTPLQSLLSIMKFLEPNYPFDQNIIFTCFKVFDSFNGKPNYGKLYQDYLCIQSSIKTKVETEVKTEVEPEVKTEVETEVKTEVEPEVKTEVETEVKTEIETEVKIEIETEVEPEIEPEVKTEIEPEVETEVKTEIEINLENEKEKDIPETPTNTPVFENSVETKKNVLDGFNEEMEAMYLELILEKKLRSNPQPKWMPQPKGPAPKKQAPAKKQVAPNKQNAKQKAKATVLFQKQQMVQKQLQKAMAQNKQFQQHLKSIHHFVK